jgi:hypothetical protein
MTTKQILLSMLILAATNNIASENSNSEMVNHHKMIRAQKQMYMKDSAKLERRLTKLELNRILRTIDRNNEIGLKNNDDYNKYSSLSPEQYKEIINAGWEKTFPNLSLKEFKESYTKREKNNDYGYPQLPIQSTDFSHVDVKQYEEKYQAAIDHELDTKITDNNSVCAIYLAHGLEIALLCNLHTIKQQQEINNKQQ